MSIVFTFPGQGAQYPGLLNDLPAHPVVAQTVEQACDVLGLTTRELDSPEALRHTRAVQLSLLIAGVASARFLQAQGCRPDMVLGLSIGAYPAAVVAGVLSLPDALRLVRLRGELMQSAYPAHYGMTAVLGLSLTEVEHIVAACFEPDTPVYVANINSADQIVVAGHEAGMRRVAEMALDTYHARKVAPLEITVPSHCALLAEQADAMRAAFKEVNFQRPACTYISARMARALFDPAKIAEDLAANMAEQVHWHDGITHARERGARLAVEMLPGQVLTPLCKSVLAPEGEALALAGTDWRTVLALAERYSQDG
jgi:malonate decarboxylase epsilon subunit